MKRSAKDADGKARMIVETKDRPDGLVPDFEAYQLC